MYVHYKDIRNRLKALRLEGKYWGPLSGKKDTLINALLDIDGVLPASVRTRSLKPSVVPASPFDLPRDILENELVRHMDEATLCAFFGVNKYTARLSLNSGVWRARIGALVRPELEMLMVRVAERGNVSLVRGALELIVARDGTDIDSKLWYCVVHSYVSKYNNKHAVDAVQRYSLLSYQRMVAIEQECSRVRIHMQDALAGRCVYDHTLLDGVLTNNAEPKSYLVYLVTKDANVGIVDYLTQHSLHARWIVGGLCWDGGIARRHNLESLSISSTAILSRLVSHGVFFASEAMRAVCGQPHIFANPSLQFLPSIFSTKADLDAHWATILTWPRYMVDLSYVWRFLEADEAVPYFVDYATKRGDISVFPILDAESHGFMRWAAVFRHAYRAAMALEPRAL